MGCLIRVYAVILLVAALVAGAPGGTVELAAKATVTAVEMEHGEALAFELRSGRVFHLVLERTQAAIIERVEPGGIIYVFEAHVRVDGQSMTLRRYTCSQECFYEPYVINGVRIWLDTVAAVFEHIPIRYPRKGNLQCLPRKDARLALQDATLRVCPEAMHRWIDDERERLDVGECYNRDNSYLGAYLGEACHVGLDVNHRAGSILTAPIGLDTHGYFNSLEAGHNNNRWRGIRRWENGDVWALQTHHLIDLLVDPNRRLEAGTRYATTAGVYVGSHEHTHFEFKIGRPRDQASKGSGDPKSIATPVDFDDESLHDKAEPEVLHLDPWILFWQIFEDQRQRQGKIKAAIEPVGPARTGEAVEFSGDHSRKGPGGQKLQYTWTFGDGGSAHGAAVSHVFARPGVYPATLVVDDGLGLDRCTQYITVSGAAVNAPVLALGSKDEPAFMTRPVAAVDTYGDSPVLTPHTLVFTGGSTRQPKARTITMVNKGGGRHAAGKVSIQYQCGDRWLQVKAIGESNEQALQVEVDSSELAVGVYKAVVSVDCPGALNSPQMFRVELRILDTLPGSDVTVDDRDAGFYATPYFWVGHQFSRCPVERRGFGGLYLTNGGRAEEGQFVRFTPDLASGRYTVSLTEATPFGPDVQFNVRVRDSRGDQVVRVHPRRSRVIGTFDFDAGMDGFVEIHAENSHGVVVADAVRFARQP